MSIPFSKEKHPFLNKLGAFYNNLPKIHPIYVIWAPSSLMKTPRSLYQISRKSGPKGRHMYVYHVNVRTPPGPINTRFLHVFLLLNISVMSFSKFTNMIDQKHSFLQLCTFLHPWTMCTRNLSPGSCFWSWKTTIITRFLVLFCFCFLFSFLFCFVLFCSVFFLTRMMISNFKINTSSPP